MIEDYEGKERLMNDRTNLTTITKNIKPLNKKQLDDLMCNYICENDLGFKDVDIIRQFVKYLKEQ